MRLARIRLAGFKSFVDPTTLHLPGELVGIVGPNGCGKSNVIDAVRWVLGESSARHLRGESMADVIFSGSSSRKPVGQASIELVFDNTGGAPVTAAGQWANVAEIAVRRQVNRDGQSVYTLNGSRCRRRDVTDLFLGTGLGPRSYAIIEQGMISRVIEARPEELRQYLEEAAGISIYRERRRETERRIRDTRDNLARLADVRGELEQQLARLQRQARNAERYRTLQAEARTLRGELMAMRMRAISETRAQHHTRIEQLQTALAAALAEQASAERILIDTREQQREWQERLNTVQAEYYAIGSDIARLEQTLAHRRSVRQRIEQELASNRAALASVLQRAADDADRLNAVNAELAELEPAIDAAEEAEALAGDAQDEAREALEDARQRRESQRAAHAVVLQAAQVERTRLDGLEQRQRDLQRRLERLDAEADGLDSAAQEAALSTLRAEADSAAQAVDETATGLRDAESVLADALATAAQLREQVAAVRADLQQDEARLTSLETLQSEALGDRAGALRDWYAEAGLTHAERLPEALQVDPVWQVAVERVLGEALQARLLPAATALPEHAPSSGLAVVVDSTLDPGASAPNAAISLPALVDQVAATPPLVDLLGGVYCAEHLEQALAVRHLLAAHESVVLADGRWLGRRWIRLGQVAGVGEGVLARQAEIADLRARLGDQRDVLDTLLVQLDTCEQDCAAHGETRDALRARHDAARSLLIRLETRCEEQAGRAQTEAKRLAAVREERAQVAEQLAQTATDRDAAIGTLESALIEADTLERAQSQAELDDARQALEQASAVLDDARSKRHALGLQLERARASQRALEEQRERQIQERARLEERGEALTRELDTDVTPDDALDAERDARLAERLVAEQTLNTLRDEGASIDTVLREQEGRRMQAGQTATSERELLDRERLHEQECSVRLSTLEEQLLELVDDPATVLDQLPDDADEARWQARLDQLEQAVTRLGAINLAAIDEHAELSERKDYLDSQQTDLEQALTTLETAMARIDRETRTRFKDTFDRVNAGLQRNYPRLFGGGEAWLELTGDDLLETGVTIMARPPGKRVSRIQLLSGGEKALTAVGLVFSIFELNPSPFCMLDEVDAPLDEANVGRFCQLVRDMSSRVQFIFITHNKTTMEIASHLLGVTMQEPGVSRVVSVDVTAAAELAGADA